MKDAAIAGPLVADSLAEFSGTQGLNGWSYGYYDGDAAAPYAPDDFELLPLFDGTKWLIEDVPTGYWTRVSATGGHPHGDITTFGSPANHWAVRRWTSSRRGLYTLSGVLADDSPAPNVPPILDPARYNGVIGHIFVDGTEVHTLPINEGDNVKYSLSLPLDAGSVVDFAIDAKPYAPDPDRTADYTDTTTFTAQIFVPEPSTIYMAGITFLFWVRKAASLNR
jgi:hypothetical protein